MTDTSSDGTEIVVRIGFEGGGLTLYRALTSAGSYEYFTELDQGMLYRMIESLDGEPMGGSPVRTSKRAATLDEGLQLFDKDPEWVHYVPMKVHPDHRAEVLAFIERRLDEGSQDPGQRIQRWRELCRVDAHLD